MNTSEFHQWILNNVGDPKIWDDEFIERLWDQSNELDISEEELHTCLGQWLDSTYVAPTVVGQFLRDRQYYLGWEILHQTDQVSLLKKGGVDAFLSWVTTALNMHHLGGLKYLVGSSPNCFSYVVNSPEFIEILRKKNTTLIDIPGVSNVLHKSEYSKYGQEFIGAIKEFDFSWVKPFIEAAFHRSVPLEQLLTNAEFISWAKNHENDLLEVYAQLNHTHVDLVLPLISKTNWNTCVWSMAYNSQKLVNGGYSASSTSLWVGGLLDCLRSVSLNSAQMIELLTCKWTEGDHDTALVGQHVLDHLWEEEIPIIIDLMKTPMFAEVSEHINWREHPRVVQYNIQQALNTNINTSNSVRKKM